MNVARCTGTEEPAPHSHINHEEEKLELMCSQSLGSQHRKIATEDKPVHCFQAAMVDGQACLQAGQAQHKSDQNTPEAGCPGIVHS